MTRSENCPRDVSARDWKCVLDDVHTYCGIILGTWVDTNNPMCRSVSVRVCKPADGYEVGDITIINVERK